MDTEKIRAYELELVELEKYRAIYEQLGNEKTHQQEKACKKVLQRIKVVQKRLSELNPPVPGTQLGLF